jgi:N-methylhydantoinase A/oxoprolinase/acetone carboxylase beta subunit
MVESVLLSGAALTADAAAEVVGRLGTRGRDELGSPGAGLRVSYDLRYRGQAFELAVPGGERPDPGELRAAFDRAHEERYGYADPVAELELVTVRVAVFEPGTEPAALGQDAEAEERGSRPAWFAGQMVDTRVLGPGAGSVTGPAVWELSEATLVVPPGWSGETDADGTIVLERA